MAAGLDRSRFTPLVVLPDEGELAADLRAAGVEVLARPLAVLRRGLLTPRGLAAIAAAAARDAAALRKLVRAREVALIHSNTSVILSGATAAATARLPHLWHVREIYTGSDFERAWPAFRTLMLSATALPCVSRATAAQFGASSRARVVPDGLAIEARRAPRAAARAALGLREDVPVIAVLGRISGWKGQDVLVRALAEPELFRRGAIALIAGAAWPGAEERAVAVRVLARSLGVDGRVRFVGFRDDVENVYGAADVIAVPSTAPDPLPGAAIEAAAAGCAVVASAHGGLSEIITDGRTGRLVTPGDPSALARAAAALIDDPEARSRLGAEAAADVRERFAPHRLLETLQALYDEVLERSG
ncbi:MAG TPA: glycosyltransferase [Solirubrobacteraceae bacterium]|jgi:glycosyltransferase involved in cell wall biosynthesis|nr:glycosyltransferase [Solirubrobacteraceae bacterium]